MPWARDEWSNIYCADDKEGKGGFGYFNHSTFTSGDVVICAGFIMIDETGSVVRISNASGHYKPSVDQLRAALEILIRDYDLDVSGTEVAAVAGPGPQGRGHLYDVWHPGHSNARFYMVFKGMNRCSGLEDELQFERAAARGGWRAVGNLPLGIRTKSRAVAVRAKYFAQCETISWFVSRCDMIERSIVKEVVFWHEKVLKRNWNVCARPESRSATTWRLGTPSN